MGGTVIIKMMQVHNAGQTTVRLRCPACRHKGTFENIGQQDYSNGTLRAGMRRCPDPTCHALVFVVLEGNGALRESFPAERIDFDTTDIPQPVVDALNEAITYRADGCFTASAIMVRKTLELLCRDRGAEGGDLKKRLQALGKKAVLPQELLDRLDELRLLGNDAAHVESQAYDQVGENEVDVGIMFTKEVLKAVYQYTALLQRLRALKKQ